ncbi:hypothetical protein [Psychroserpens luteus]|uniref:PKD domain-containing protein n=1 Tax=Psychroserpens luteus TaxID=1434066 RepID=A0ABW5ZS56_9FLAO|nr:hypothetical protein [Psychroserpens luteus]
MKIVKYVLSICFVALAVYSCAQDDDNTDFVNSIQAPTNISANVVVTQDNTGLVTITPLGEGVTTYVIGFGDGSDNSDDINPGSSVNHTYEEGTYEATITANGLNGLSTTVTQQIVVSFQAPENLMVTIENDTAISRQVNVTASADFALSYEVDFGQSGSDPIMGNIEDTVSFMYDAAGTYTITVTAFSAAVETVSYTEDFEVTEILAPLSNAPIPPSRDAGDVVSIFSDVYSNVTLNELPTVWSSTNFSATTIDGNNVWLLSSLDFLGMVTNYDIGEDVSTMEKMHIDYWVPSGATNGLLVKIVNTVDGGEAEQSLGTTVSGSWQSIELDMTGFDDGDLANKNKITQLLIDSDGVSDVVYIDNFYFYKAPSNTPEGLEGTWRMASVAGSLGVGPGVGDISWFPCDDACVTERACYFDDTYTFGSDGSFSNDLGAESWIEPWQGGGDACGVPVAPHDGSNPATYTYNEAGGTVTLNGIGAYLGLAKANNQGELPDVAVPGSVTYNVAFTGANSIDLYIESGAGVFWQYKMVRESAISNPLAGTWLMASESGSLGVGPAVGDISWFPCDDPCVAERACYFDDTYVFGADGSFSNNLGAESWIEPWQGGGDACGTPVAPHDGSNTATYLYDEGAGTVTLNGIGAYLGLAKANNQGELPDVAVPTSITYNLTFVDANTITVYVESGAGVFWQYKLVKQ